MGNQLINRGILEQRDAAARQNQETDMAKKPELNENSRCCLYSTECPEGRVFVGGEDIAAAKTDGWKDAPGKVKGGKGASDDSK